MEETVTYEQGLEQQDPIPKPKKLKIKDFAAKIKAKYPDYKDIDDTELTNKIITKYPEYKDQVDLTPETSKKKVGTIGFEESSLRAGNVLSQSGGVGGEEIPQIEMYTLPNGEMVETDPVSISRKYKELKDRKKTVTEGVGSSFGMGTGTTKEVEDEESQKAAKKLAEDFKGLDIEGINDDTQGLSDDLIRLYKNDILPDREENNQLYQRKLANIKWRSSFEKKLLEDVDNGNIDPDNYNRIKHGIEQLPISTGQGDYSNQRAAVKSLAADIREYGGENRDKLLKDFAVEVSKVYGNPDNKAEEKFKDSPESKYLNTDAQLGYQYLQDVSPDKAEQYKRLFIDPKSLKDNPDELRGYNHLMQTLEETGINLKQNAVTEELNSLNKQAKMNGGLTPEQIERATKLENVNEELSAKRNELDSKYPDRIGDKIDDAVQEVMGQKTSGLNYAGGKVFTAFRNTAQGVWEAASSPFMSDESNTLRELAIMGQSLEDEKIYHKTDKNKALQYDAMVIKPELQKEVDLIKNNNLLTDDQKEQKLYKLFRENTDKFGRVPIKGGKFNVSPSSIMYGMTDLGTSLLPFVAIEAATGGIGGAGAGAKFLRTFTAAAATTFHDEYAAALMEGKSQSEAYRSAMASTAINSLAMAGAGTPTEIRAMASTKTSAGKLIQSMSDDAIEAVLKKGTPKGLKAVAQNVKERLKATPEMLKQGVKTGAKFEAYMGAANAINGREQDFKRSLLAIGEFGILGAALGQAAFKTPTQLQKSAGLEFGKKPDEYIAIAESMKKDGLLTDAQLEQRTELIKSYGEAYKSLPKNLDEKQQREYLYETVIKNEATKGKSNLPPKQAAEAEHRAMVADYKRQIILDQPTKKELENRKKQLEKLLEPPEINEKSGKAETISESVKKNYEAEIEAIDTHLDTTKKEVKEEELPNLSQPIEGTDEKGVPIGENVPPETKTTDVVESEKDEIFYTGRGKKFDDLTKTKGDFIFFSKNPKVSEWYGGDAENVTQAKLDTKDFLDLTTQEKKSDFVDRNFTDKDIQELYPDLSKRAFDDRDVRKTYEQKLKALTDKYRQRLKENRFSGSDKEQKFLLNKLKEKGYKGVKLADTFFGEPDISYVAIDKSVINTKPENKPIEGVDEFGVPIGENVPPEVKGEPEQITQPIELSVEQKGKDVVVDEGVGKDALKDVKSTTKALDNIDYVQEGIEDADIRLGTIESLLKKARKDILDPEADKSWDKNHYQFNLQLLSSLIAERKDYENIKKENAERDFTEMQGIPPKDENGKFIKNGKEYSDYIDRAILPNLNKNIDNFKNYIAEAYHKSKADGSNPELVKAVEQSLSTPKAEPQQSGKDVVVDEGVGGKNLDILTKNTNLQQNEQAKAISEAENKGTGISTPTFSEKSAKEKPLNLSEKVRQIEDVTDPYDRALQHFATDGKINSSAINELFGGKDARIRFKSSTENEKRARISLIGKDAPTIDKLAHELWESDNTGRYTTQDYKDAIERVILDYNSKSAMQKDLVERYDYDAAYEKYINQAYGKEAMEVVNKMTDDEINHILKLEAEKASEEEIANYIDNLQSQKVEPKVETTKTEDNAIQVRNATEVPLGETPGDSSKMGEGVPQPEIPTQKGEVKGEEVKVGKFESKAREIAGKIKATELPSWLKIDDPNVKKKGIGEEEVKKALADATIKMGKLLDKGVEFGQAVKEAVEDLVNMLGEGMRSSIEKGFGEEYKSKFGGEFEQRRFTKQMLRSDELSAESKAEISKTLNYVRQSNAMSLKEAAEAVEKVGLDEAQNLVMNDASMKGAVRVTLGQTIIKKYNELSEKATDQETRDYYLDKSIQTANFVTERLATEPGQTIQAFSMWSRLSPEGQLRAANQDMARQGQEKLRRREKDINKIAKEFQKANEETAEEVVKSEVLKEEPTENISKGKQKIIKAKEKRASIIKKYKAEKGKNLFSSPTGLTPEGIEFVGNIAKTYLDEGVANLQVLVEKIINHLEEVAGKKATDEIKKQVSEEADRMFNKADIKLIGEALKDKKIKIADIVKKHYTVVEASKKKLVQKLMDEADMSQSNAYELAKRVEAAFDRIATRKKRNILYNEKARFDKINNTLNGAKKVEKKTVADDIIKYSNLGAFEGKEFADMMANKFGIGEISPEQAAKLLQLAKKVQEAPEGTPKNNATEDLLAYRANLRGNDLGETAQAVWYASVLSGYKTHEKNLVSTFFNSMGELTAEMVKDPKSIPYLIAGYVKGISHRGRIEAAHTLKTGYSPIHIKKIETPNVLERKDFVGGAINPGNWFKYVMRLMVAEDVLSFQGLKEARAYQLARKEAAGRDFNTWSKKGWDEVNKILLHTKERYDEAFETIKEEGLVNDNGKPTLEGKRRIYEIMENSRPEKMVNDSYGFAAHGTFNHESEGSLGAITNAVASGLDSVHLGSFKPARLVVPFTRIITNVVNNSLDYTPIGLIRAARGVRGFRSFEKNVITKPAFKELSKDERQRLVAKAAIGITSAVALQAMHQAGTIQITGGGTGDKQKDQQLRDSGWQEYSVKIGDRYYSYKYTPLVFMLGYMGNMNDAQKYGDDDEKTLTKKMEVATSRIAGQVVDMTWINSSATFLGALAEKNPDRQGVAVSKALASMTRGFIPFGGAITQGTQLLNSAFHANKKQADGAWQALVATIPIAQNSLNDKINALGDPIQVNENTWPLLPDFVSKEKDDPVWKFLLDKQGWVAPVNKNTLIVFDQKTEQDRPITSDEYYEFSKKRGAKIKYQLQQLLLSGEMVDWNSGETMKLDKVSPKDFNEWLSKIEENATEETKAELFGIPPTKVTKNLDINQ